MSDGLRTPVRVMSVDEMADRIEELEAKLAAERERCVKIVETEGMPYAGLREGTILERVAAAIRKVPNERSEEGK